jgi:hypothetical protein
MLGEVSACAEHGPTYGSACCAAQEAAAAFALRCSEGAYAPTQESTTTGVAEPPLAGDAEAFAQGRAPEVAADAPDDA